MDTFNSAWFESNLEISNNGYPCKMYGVEITTVIVDWSIDTITYVESNCLTIYKKMVMMVENNVFC